MDNGGGGKHAGTIAASGSQTHLAARNPRSMNNCYCDLTPSIDVLN